MADLRSKFIEDYAGGLLNVSRQELASTGEVLSQDGLLADASLFVEDGAGVKSGLKLGAAICEVVDPTTSEGAVNVRYADRTYASVRDLKIFSTAIASAQAALADASSTSITNLENAFQLLEDSQNTLSTRFESRTERVDEKLTKLDKITEIEEGFENLTATVNTVDAKIQTRETDIDLNTSNISAIVSEFADGISGDESTLQKALTSIQDVKAKTGVDLTNITSGIVLRTDSTQQDFDGKKIESITFKGFNSQEYKTCAEIISNIDDTTLYDPDVPATHSVSGDLVFAVTKAGEAAPAARMRIDNQGAFAIQSTGSCLFVSSEVATGDASNAVFIGRYGATTFPSGTATSYIWTNGGLANYQSNNSDLSDIREKKNIEPLDSTWDKVKSWELKKYHYNFDEDTADKRYGVIAQDIQQTCPDLVTIWNEDDAEDAKLGVKAQLMDWMAIKALQEAQLKIEQLEAKVAALESAGGA